MGQRARIANFQLWIHTPRQRSSSLSIIALFRDSQTFSIGDVGELVAVVGGEWTSAVGPRADSDEFAAQSFGYHAVNVVDVVGIGAVTAPFLLLDIGLYRLTRVSFRRSSTCVPNVSPVVASVIALSI
jgi:hypothetical protein